ncbi:Methyltransferase type 11 [Sulfobacillus acidophilus TPY]|uniref:Methyltransferase type 11 n=1 Tax=Sulfobacillus acidophilus (strain ATCC 700253 / DSM 10332 / NAL) TaxID=679936 RepID=G8TXJ5_SULAD|nr:Methyltransferase type 11 [Sulfobacillus acidophilus TPY]AEW03894.1 Methyltransferase type 11 [Sulfobacillus acidophilus DSM 10332]
MISFEQLDQWLVKELQAFETAEDWLLLQTLVTRDTRRQWLGGLPWTSRDRVMDFGCGSGIVAWELAALKGCQVIGLDQDETALRRARRLVADLPIHPSPRFIPGDVLHPPFVEKLTGGFSRFVLQYVPDPKGLLGLWARQLEKGSYLAIEDIDDGFIVEYPEPPAAWQRIVDAFRQYQAGPGGDRLIGRKLAVWGKAAGLTVITLDIAPNVYSGPLQPEDTTVQFDILRIRQALPTMVSQGLLAPEDFQRGVDAYLASLPHDTFISVSTVRILFRT